MGEGQRRVGDGVLDYWAPRSARRKRRPPAILVSLVLSGTFWALLGLSLASPESLPRGAGLGLLALPLVALTFAVVGTLRIRRHGPGWRLARAALALAFAPLVLLLLACLAVFALDSW